MFHIRVLTKSCFVLGALFLSLGAVSFADHLSALEPSGRYAQLTESNHAQALVYNPWTDTDAYLKIDEITTPMVLLSNCVVDPMTFEECWHDGVGEYWGDCLDRQRSRGVGGYSLIYVGCNSLQTKLLGDILKYELQLLKIVGRGYYDLEFDMQQGAWEMYSNSRCRIAHKLLNDGGYGLTGCLKRELVDRIIEIERLRIEVLAKG